MNTKPTAHLLALSLGTSVHRGVLDLLCRRAADLREPRTIAVLVEESECLFKLLDLRIGQLLCAVCHGDLY